MTPAETEQISPATVYPAPTEWYWLSLWMTNSTAMRKRKTGMALKSGPRPVSFWIRRSS